MRIVNRITRSLTLLLALGVITIAAKADTSLYSDGPTLGTNVAWTINFDFQVQDSFTLSSSSTLNSVTFGNWLFTGDTASTVDWAIVDSEASSTLACGSCSGTAGLSGAFDFTNGSYDIYDQTFSLSGVNLAAGTYWLELQNEVVSNGDPGYWDENGGPSSVWESQLGDVSGSNCTVQTDQAAGSCSDAFTIYGTNSTGVTPEPGSLALLFSGVTLIGAEIRRRRII